MHFIVAVLKWFLHFAWTATSYLCCLFPIKRNRIVFDNFGGRGFGDNPAYIVEELLKSQQNLDLVWLSKKKDIKLPNGVRCVKSMTLQAAYCIMTAKIRVSNVKNSLRCHKRKGQHYIQTWHGDLPFKLIEGECEETLSETYLKTSKADSERIDIILSGSSLMTDIYRKAFWLPESCEILECGLPRNDVYFNFSAQDIKALKRDFFGDEQVNIAIYAPTFRDDGSTAAYGLDEERLHNFLEKRDSKRWIVVVRLHPNIAKKSGIFNYNSHVVDGSAYPDPQKLFLASDLLITDYSSLVSDFMIMKKPIFLFCTDLEEYVSKCRQLRPMYYKLPFGICRNNDELLDKMSSFQFDKYIKQVEEFCSTYYNIFDNGNASSVVADKIMKIINQ